MIFHGVMLRKTVAAAMVAAGVLSVVNAVEPADNARIDAAVKRYDGGDRAGAFQELLALEKTNDQRVLARLGICYLNGHGTKPDGERAYRYLSAAGDDPEGQALNGLGICYYRGEAIRRDVGKALELYEKAWKKGNPYAAFNLGRHYMELGEADKATQYYQLVLHSAKSPKPLRAQTEFSLGLIAEAQNDMTTASAYFVKAAEQGFKPNDASLAMMYYFGTTIPFDLKKALAYAEKSGDKDLYGLISYGIAMEKLLWKDNDGAKKYMTVAADNGYREANWYAYTLTGEKKYCIAAAQAGDKRAFCNAAAALATQAEKAGLPKDAEEFKTAMKWYLAAAEEVDTAEALNALCSIGMMTRIGEAVAPDYDKAMQWYQKAADWGFPRALREIGVKYSIRSGKSENPNDENKLLMLDNLATAALLGDEKAWDFLREDKWLSNAQVAFALKPEQLRPEQKLALGAHWLLTRIKSDPASLKTGVDLIKAAAAEGSVFPKDLKYAAECLRKAVAQGSPYADKLLLNSVFADEVGENERKEIWTRLAAVGVPWARYNLASMYERHGDMPTAIELYKEGAAKGNAQSQYRLFNLMFAGKHKSDSENMFDYLYKAVASNLGDAEVVEVTSKFWSAERTVPRFDAVMLMKGIIDGANDLGNALMELAEKYVFGQGVKKDSARALQLLEAGVKAGFPDCYNLMGQMYRWGYFGPENHEKAVECFKAGIAQGSKSCEESLRVMEKKDK